LLKINEAKFKSLENFVKSAVKL